MSKLFDALQRGKGEVSKIILPELLNAAAAPNIGQNHLPIAHEIEKSEPAQTHPTTKTTAAKTSTPQPRTVRVRLGPQAPLLPFDQSHWAASEQYRVLRTKVLQHLKHPRIIVISSACTGDGKSVTAINIAGALALKAGVRVLLLDADFRRSTIHTQLGIPASPGLANVLENDSTLEDALVQVEQLPNLYVLSAGQPTLNPAELLDSPRWSALLNSSRTSFAYVIVDSPPIATVADYHLIEANCDGVILVVRPDHTNRRACAKALEIVSKEKLLGVILNCVTNWFVDRYTSGYYQSGYYGPATSELPKTR
jgi:capsular exopolysaccharide synthesis family protein